MNKFLTISLAAVALAIAAPRVVDAAPATVTIGAIKDGTLYKNHVERGSGGGNGLWSGTNGREAPRRAPIEFDIAGHMPAGATILSVQLTLVLGQLPTEAAPTSTVGLHRIAAAWGEGPTQLQNPPNDSFAGMGQGAPATEGDATWNSRFFSATTPTPWTTPGGDFNPIPSASSVVGTVFNVGYDWGSTAAMVGDVQGWLDNPAANYGWMLVNADEIGQSSFRVFYSRHVATAEWRPQLSITYEAVPEPAGLALVLVGAATAAAQGGLMARKRRAKSCESAATATSPRR